MKAAVVGSALASICAVSLAAPAGASALETYNQRADALAPCIVRDYVSVDNEQLGIQASRDYTRYELYPKGSHHIAYSRGSIQATFDTLFHLPLSYGRSGDLGNPQSMVITPDGHYAYIAYPTTKSYESPGKGRIARYDLWALQDLGAFTGDLSEFARAVLHKSDKRLQACLKVGPYFTMGHGQDFALDPATGNIWFSSQPRLIETDLTRIDPDTLAPDRKISFRLNPTVAMGNDLCFDRKGRFYFCTYTKDDSWPTAPSGTVKFYRGKFNKKQTRVKIRLTKQGVRNAAGSILQGIACNTIRGCLYVLSDSAILRVPLNKLNKGTLKPEDIDTEVFSPIREFESLAFTEDGTGYLIANKHAEILRANGDL